MCWPSTGMSRVSSRTEMRLHEGVLGDRPDAIIDPAAVDDRLGRRVLTGAESLDAPRMHGGQAGVRAEDLQGGDLGRACPPGAPGLLKHSRAPASLGTALRDVVVPPRGEQPRELFPRSVVHARL